MQTLTSAGAGYRTKCLTEEHADLFAQCLRSNGKFTNVEVREEPRAKGDRRFYVTYQPSDPEQQERLLQAHSDQRRAKAESEGEQYLFVENPEGGNFFWCQSVSGEVYEVTLHNCTCPDAEFRCRENGLRCKHSHALESAKECGAVLTF